MDNALLKLQLNDSQKMQANMQKRIDYLREGLEQIFKDARKSGYTKSYELREEIIEILTKDNSIAEEIK